MSLVGGKALMRLFRCNTCQNLSNDVEVSVLLRPPVRLDSEDKFYIIRTGGNPPWAHLKTPVEIKPPYKCLICASASVDLIIQEKCPHVKSDDYWINEWDETRECRLCGVIQHARLVYDGS